MSPIDWCAAEVRRDDYDRYLSALFAPAHMRPHLFALYATNHEIAKTAEVAHDAFMGAIRLQWWREAIGELYDGRPRAHQALLALSETLRGHTLPQSLFLQIIEARESDFESEPFANLAEMEAYADATSGSVMRLAGRILDGDTAPGNFREAGIAYALTGLLRALPFRAAHRRLVIPHDIAAQTGLNAEDVFAGRIIPAVNTAMEKIAIAAEAHLDAARAVRAGTALPALLPAALCPVYLRVMRGASFNPFRDATDVTRTRRQLAMLRARLTGRI
ncbi:MAG: phytoene/squalene synthase family protein [Alphaproteobacteria bacterium]